MQGKVLCFGEILLRISPDLSEAWLEKEALPFYLGGAELNVASALALWGIPAAYVTAMPMNTISTSILTHLEKRNVEVSKTFLQGNRLGLYYLTRGSDLKNAGLVYDRAGSSFAELKRGDIDWDDLFDGVRWFHFSAICPAINQELADICLDAVKEAANRNITVSLDLNYRSKLWKYGKEPIEIMPTIASYCDVIMGNVWASNQMLGTSLELDLQNTKPIYPKELLLKQAEETSMEIVERFEKCKIVVNTFRFDYDDIGIQYFTTMYNEGRLIVSDKYVAQEIVSRVGSGDCFMAGLIYGLYNEIAATESLAFATAAAFDKFFTASDSTSSSVMDIQNRIKK